MRLKGIRGRILRKYIAAVVVVAIVILLIWKILHSPAGTEADAEQKKKKLDAKYNLNHPQLQIENLLQDPRLKLGNTFQSIAEQAPALKVKDGFIGVSEKKTRGFIELFHPKLDNSSFRNLKIDPRKLEKADIGGFQKYDKDGTRISIVMKKNIGIKKNQHNTLIPESHTGCQKTVPFRQRYQADISTYDLPDITNYTLSKEGRYIIPVKNPQDAYDPDLENVQVIVVPFSHADPGYGRTMEDYYSGSIKYTFNFMVDRLSQYRNMTFQWVETVFLERWWRDASNEQKKQLKELLDRGQLEIVLGGWVMPDEASTHYCSVVDQLIEGHHWLLEHLGVHVKNAWVNDPFGYSSTMPYLWKSSGIENMVFLRIHQAIKSTLMKKKSLDFNWRPYWSKDNRNDLLCTLMAYENYWVADVCGPNPRICKEFAFMHRHSIKITPSNIEVQARKLYEQYRITADLYQYNTLYIGIGEDFSFTTKQSWDDVYHNFDKLMQYINNKQEWKINIKFGTLKDYFASVRKNENNNNNNNKMKFPTLSGDFFPYSDKENAYWTGYFTTRPLNKRISREIEPVLKIAEIYNVFTYSSHRASGMKYIAYKEVANLLRNARRQLGMFLHHDGITGTSLPHVISDFETRLQKAEHDAHAALKTIMATILSHGLSSNKQYIQEERKIRPAVKLISESVVIDCETTVKNLILVNPLERSRDEFVSIVLNSDDVAINHYNGSNVELQITRWQPHPSDQRLYIATFRAALPPFSTEVFTIKPFGMKKSASNHNDKSSASTGKTIVLRNSFISVEFDGKTGTLRRITDRDGHITEISSEFMIYRTTKSGAYLFGPSGPASSIHPQSPTVMVTRGLHMSSVTVEWPGVHHRVTLYNSTSVQGQGLYIRNEVDLKELVKSNSEIVLRFRTNVKNGNKFYTDQNGFTLIGRKTIPWNRIESNFYPITTMAVLEDSNKRVTLHSGQPLGVSSLDEGWLEVMLDRTMTTDDGRGLGQGVMDIVKVDSEFILQVEHKTTAFPSPEPRYTAPSLSANIMNDQLRNPVIKLILHKDILMRRYHPLKNSFPCDVSVVGLRNLVLDDLTYNGTSLVLHRRPHECGYQTTGDHCVLSSGILPVDSIFPGRSVSISEMSLSQVYTRRQLSPKHDLKPDLNEIRTFRLIL